MLCDQALYYAFFYVMPSSRPQFIRVRATSTPPIPTTRLLHATCSIQGFKRIVYLECIRVLSGLDMAPATVQAMRFQIFPDDHQDDDYTLAGLVDTLAPMPGERNKNDEDSEGDENSDGYDNADLVSSVHTSTTDSKDFFAAAPSEEESQDQDGVFQPVSAFIGTRDDVRFLKTVRLAVHR